MRIALMRWLSLWIGLVGAPNVNAYASTTYRVDALRFRDLKSFFQIAGSNALAIRHPGAALRDSPALAASRRFVQYLSSTDAAGILLPSGFIVLPRSAVP